MHILQDNFFWSLHKEDNVDEFNRVGNVRTVAFSVIIVFFTLFVKKVFAEETLVV